MAHLRLVEDTSHVPPGRTLAASGHEVSIFTFVGDDKVHVMVSKDEESRVYALDVRPLIEEAIALFDRSTKS